MALLLPVTGEPAAESPRGAMTAIPMRYAYVGAEVLIGRGATLACGTVSGRQRWMHDPDMRLICIRPRDVTVERESASGIVGNPLSLKTTWRLDSAGRNVGSRVVEQCGLV
jgi:hypothetical protein